jgi:hypothetical protein
MQLELTKKYTRISVSRKYKNKIDYFKSAIY